MEIDLSLSADNRANEIQLGNLSHLLFSLALKHLPADAGGLSFG